MEIKSEKDLQELINNKIEESTTLEYKSMDSLTNNAEIAKDISAMANSEGGLIIYGIKEDAEKYPEEIEWSSDKGLKDKIDQVLSSKITRKIEGCNIKEVQSDRDNKKFVIVVNVPRSDIAPHQSNKSVEVKKYYRRSNSRIREMEHGEVEDLFFARKRPKLEIELRRTPTKIPAYEIIIHNKGKVLAEKISIKFLIPSVLKIIDDAWSKIKDGYTHKGYGYSEYQYTGNEYVYPELPTCIGKIFHSKEECVVSLDIGFLIVCEDMEIKRGKIIMGDRKPTEIIYLEKGVPLPDWEFKDGFYSIYHQ
ncbi:ATP-binding protein [Candidatus Pacearchaeota archaeon]|nr:ATP-binding protein [Candidatus Pacearchaeota archaeon]